jgi:peptidoglycan DL-endopeptidase CwlO
VASAGSRRRVRTAVAACAALTVGLVLVPSAGHSQSIDDVREEVERLNHEAIVVVEEANVAREKLKAAEKQLRVIQDRVAVQQRSLDELRDEVGIYLAMAYRNGGVDETIQLFTSDDPERFLEQAATLDQLSTQQADALRRLQLAKQELEQTKQAARQEVVEIEKIRADLAEKTKEIEARLRQTTALLNRLTAEQRDALNEPSEEPPPNIAVSGRARAAVDFAMAQLGEPYVWGGAGPGSWDCSGLTMMAWRAAGVSLPHSSAQQIGYGTRGFQEPAAARRPRLLLQPNQPRRHVHRRWEDDPRPEARRRREDLAGGLHRGVCRPHPARLTRPTATERARTGTGT